MKEKSLVPKKKVNERRQGTTGREMLEREAGEVAGEKVGKNIIGR